MRKLLLQNPLLATALRDRELRYAHHPGPNPAQLDAQQLHARLAWSGSGVDLALQASSLLDAFGVPSLPAPQQLEGQRIDLPSYHPRYALLGQAGAVSLGAFLLRWELAGELQRPQIVRRTDSPLPEWSMERLNSLRGLFGVTYVPSTRTSLALELLGTRVLDNPERRPDSGYALLFPVEAGQAALRFGQALWRDRLQLTVVVLWIGLVRFNALAGRAELSYALLDALRASLGYVHYQPSSQFGPFYGFERNDRLYLNLRWDIAAR
jgi:hypothetical protein